MTFYSVSNPFPLVLNLQGTGLNDGDVYFGVAGQDPITHPKTVYWDIGGTDVAAQPIPTTGGYLYRSGTPANVYLDSVYSIKVLDKNGATVYYQANVFDPVFQIAADLAAFEASLASTAGAGDVGFSHALTYSQGTVGNHLKRFVVITDAPFNAIGDDGTDNTSAIDAAIAYVSGSLSGGQVIVPSGIFRHAQLAPITANNVTIICLGDAAILKITELNNYAYKWAGVSGGGANIHFTYAGNPSAGAVAIWLHGTQTMRFDVWHENTGTVFQFGTSGDNTSYANGTQLKFKGSIFNGGKPLFKGYFHNGVFVESSQAYVNGVGTPAINRTSTMTTLPGTVLFDLTESTYDDFQVTGSCLFERFYKTGDWATDGSGRVNNNTYISRETVCDFIRSTCYSLLAGTTGGMSGGIINCNIGGYGTSWEDATLLMGGTGGNFDHNVSMLSVFSGKEGFKVYGGSTRRVALSDCVASAANRLNGGTANGIDVQDATVVSINNCRSGYDTTSVGLPWQPVYGFRLGPDMDYLNGAGNYGAGSTAGFLLETCTSPSINRNFQGNIGANYAGIRGSTASPATDFTLPAANTPWNNLQYFTVEIAMGGGTVTGITRDGGVTGMTQGNMSIPPGHNFSWGGSVAPTYQFFGIA